MKRLFLALSIVLILASCDNGDTDDEEANPYPDGVYPFEVTNVTHTEYLSELPFLKFVITWDNPTDKYFKRVEYEAFGYTENGEEFPLISPSGADPYNFKSILDKNSLAITVGTHDKQHVIIKCVDRFNNISTGVDYDYFTPNIN